MGKNVDSFLPRDPDDHPIQVLAPGTPTNASLAGTSTASALPSGAEIIEIGLSEDGYVAFGTSGSTVTTSNGMFIAKGNIVYRVPPTATHLIHIAASTTGRITFWKLT